jgi:uncharacterized protein (TIGR02145 family)
MRGVARLGWALAVAAAVLGLMAVGCVDDDNPPNVGDYVTLGGKTWMTKNLNVETEDSWCYDDNPANCAKYGRLYTWGAAKAACQSIGKRLPTSAEWDALVTATGDSSSAGKKLKSKRGWYKSGLFINGNGTDDFGFSALPGGYRYYDGDFYEAGDDGYWWTATVEEKYGYTAYYRNMSEAFVYVYKSESFPSLGYSVRCVE